MSERGGLSLPPELVNMVKSDCVKAYLNNNIPENWTDTVMSIVLLVLDSFAGSVEEHEHKEETTKILSNLCIQLEDAKRGKEND